MMDDEMAKQFADGYATPDIEPTLRMYLYECSKESFLAGLEKGKNMNVSIKWHLIKDNDFPTKEGIYLTWRNWNGNEYSQILSFDGKYWVVGNDHPDNMIVAWKEIMPPKGSE